MAKEKKYVKVQSEETEGKEGKVSYATDSKGNLRKVEKESAESRKGRANELKDEDYDYISKDKNDNQKEIN